MINIFCFAKGTKVSTPNGSLEIELIQLGDSIISYNHTKKLTEGVVVENVATSHHDIINRITFSNGILIESTVDHPYWVVDKGWCSVKSEDTKKKYQLSAHQLEINDNCFFFDGKNIENVKVDTIEHSIGNYVMYNISGGNNHCFFAGGILVHDENISHLKLNKPNIEKNRLSVLRS